MFTDCSRSRRRKGARRAARRRTRYVSARWKRSRASGLAAQRAARSTSSSARWRASSRRSTTSASSSIASSKHPSRASAHASRANDNSIPRFVPPIRTVERSISPLGPPASQIDRTARPRAPTNRGAICGRGRDRKSGARPRAEPVREQVLRRVIPAITGGFDRAEQAHTFGPCERRHRLQYVPFRPAGDLVPED